MEIQGIKFIGPVKLDYSQLPADKGLYIINSPIGDEFAPQYIGYSANLKRRLRNFFAHNPFSSSILDSSDTALFYAVLNDMSIEEIKEIEKQLIMEFNPTLNKHILYKDVPTQTKIKFEKTKKLSYWISVITSLMAAIISIFIITNLDFNFGGKSSRDIEIPIHQLKLENQKFLIILDSLKTELSTTIKQLEETYNTSEININKFDFIKLKESVNSIERRLGSLESAIIFDPEKALSIPLMKKDLENAEKNFTNELHLTRSSVDRMYDQNKWFIVLMFTISLSVLGMALSNIIRKKE